jgi:hypothetical protein
MTATAELALVDAAITKILTSGIQSYGTNGRNANFVSLKDLQERKAALEAKIAAESGGGFYVAQMRNPE